MVGVHGHAGHDPKRLGHEEGYEEACGAVVVVAHSHVVKGVREDDMLLRNRG